MGTVILPSPLPAVGFTIATAAGAPSEVTPGLYANTHTVIIRNPSAAAQDLWVAFGNVVGTFGVGTINMAPAFATFNTPLVGDTVTLDGNVLTAVGGAAAAGTDTWSVDNRAEATITVNAATSYQAGDTLELLYDIGPPVSKLTLTAVVGPRVPGSNTFDVAGTANAQAAAIAAALNDSDFTGLAYLQSAAAVGAVVTTIAGGRALGAWGNSALYAARQELGPGGVRGLVWQTSPSVVGSVTVSTFTGGENVFGGTEIGFNTNDRRSFGNALAQAILDPTNSVFATFNKARSSDTGVVGVLAAAAGVAGNGLVLSTTGAPRITIGTSPTAGGADAPAVLAAATSMVVAPNQVLTLNVGVEGSGRNSIQPSSHWTTTPGANLGLLLQMAGGAAENVPVIYVNGG